MYKFRKRKFFDCTLTMTFWSEELRNSWKRDLPSKKPQDKMLDDMTQYEMRNWKLHGPFDYQFKRKRIFDHNKWKQSILVAEFLRLLIQKRQRKLDCVAADEWVPLWTAAMGSQKDAEM